MVEGLSDGDLVAATLKGSQEAFGELVARYRDAVFGAALHRLGRFEEARDAAQETFVKAYMHLRDLRKRESFANWLYHIADGTALDFARRPRREVALDSVAEGALADNAHDEHTEQSDLALQVREALSKLGESTRLAVILHYINGYSHAEVANFLGTSTGAVKTRICRAKSKLREEIEPMKQALKETERLFSFLVYNPVDAEREYTEGFAEAKSLSEIRMQLKQKGYRPWQILNISSISEVEIEQHQRDQQFDPIDRVLFVLINSVLTQKGTCLKIWKPKESQENKVLTVSVMVDGTWRRLMRLPCYVGIKIAEKLSQMAGMKLTDGVAKRPGNMLFKYWEQDCQMRVTIGKRLMRIALPENWWREAIAQPIEVPKDQAEFYYTVDSPQGHIFSGIAAAKSITELEQRFTRGDWSITTWLVGQPAKGSIVDSRGQRKFDERTRRINKEALQKIIKLGLRDNASSIVINDQRGIVPPDNLVYFIVKGKKQPLVPAPSIDIRFFFYLLADMSGIEVQFPQLGNKKQIGRMSYEYEGKTYEFKVALHPRTRMMRIDRIKLPRRSREGRRGG